MTKPRVLVTTVPFGEIDDTPLRILEQAGVEVVINPLGRKLTEGELAEMAAGFDAIVAGTEPNTAKVFAKADKLKLVARVGIGLDSVDLMDARARNIAVSFTPDAPSPAVAELSVGLIIDVLRGVGLADRKLRQGTWHRVMGRRVSESTIGIIGVGRIGKKVIRHLSKGFPGVKILANDLQPDLDFGAEHGVTWCEKDEIYRRCDVVSLHVPLKPDTMNLVTKQELSLMQSHACLVNTARGGIVNEDDLLKALRDNVIAQAAVDVFETEPYKGPLRELPNCTLTCHMGSMSRDCRTQMEIEACQEVARFFSGQALANPVPESEYLLAASFAAKK